MWVAIRHLRHLWWRAAKHREIAATAVLLLLLTVVLTVRFHGRPPPAFAAPPAPAPAPVPLTPIQNAVEKGAVCLDGSVPQYHFDRGSGAGTARWLVHLEGGGWCNSVESCAERAKGKLGSSRYMNPIVFEGMFSPLASRNPDFYNWNRVLVRYCDGASFSGDVESEIHDGTKLFFRGQRIWKAVMNDLLLQGLTNAKQAFLTGCSAGGLSTFLHCDSFHEFLPEVATVKCLADAGFFLDEKDLSGKRTMQSIYSDVVHLQNVERNLQKNCLSTSEPTQCFFPHQIIKHITTPIFVLNSAYDWWQIQNVLVPDPSDPQQHWRRCKYNIHNCNDNQIEFLHGFRKSLLNSLTEFQNNKQRGMLINSCFAHCQSMFGLTWHSPESTRINNKTIAEVVGDWFFGRSEVKEVDCAYPCNPTCHHIDLSWRLAG